MFADRTVPDGGSPLFVAVVVYDPYCLMQGLPTESFCTGAAVGSRESTCWRRTKLVVIACFVAAPDPLPA